MVVTRPVDPLSAARSDLGELTGPAVMRMTRSELSRLRSPGEALISVGSSGVITGNYGNYSR